MANIMDYIDWRGDLTLGRSGFNDVDNLILAQLTYVDFEKVVPAIGCDESISVKEASDLFFKLRKEEKNGTAAELNKSELLLAKMALYDRFSGFKLSKYVNIIDYEEQKQFSAINISLEDGTLYVAYRGTGDTVVGWKENFNMSFITPVPAQLEAVKYLEETVGGSNRKVRVGGHSKGGNLAVYAAVNCCTEVKEKIIEVYNNDGPGFDEKIIASDEYKEVVGRIRTIVPQSSIVGMLLEHEEEYVVVRSNQTGLLQHDALSWDVLGNKFVYLRNITRRSKLIDVAVKSWLNKLGDAQREQFIDSLFYIFETANVKNLGDLSHDKLKKMSEIIKIINNMAPENKEILTKTIRLLIQERNRVFSYKNRKMLN